MGSLLGSGKGIPFTLGSDPHGEVYVTDYAKGDLYLFARGGT
jgi:hypothetical protein